MQMKHGHKRGTRDVLTDNVVAAFADDETLSAEHEHVARLYLAGIDKTLREMNPSSQYKPWLERLRGRVVEMIAEFEKRRGGA